MSAPPAEPIFFGPDDRPLAGWLHRPAIPSASVGVVVCNPFGYEAVCAHRSLRHVAEAAAAAGAPALRFDYDGTGDSAGDDRDPERFAAWVGSVHHAIVALRQLTALRHVVLFGLRLGVLIAAFAAGERDDVVGLVAFAPVISGKAYLRELKFLQGALGLDSPPAGVAVDPTVQEALGFAITEETRAALSQTDLAQHERRPAPALLVLDREELPTAEPWIAHLKSQGAAVQARRLTGYVEMVLAPHNAVVPTAAIEVAIAWLAARATSAESARPPAPAVAPRRLARVSPCVNERAVFVDAARRMFGVCATPAAALPSGRAILLLNAGAVHHIGPNRLYTMLARRWAALGHIVLRLDITGVGDSRPRPGAPENVVYSPCAVEDVAEAVAWLRRQPGVADCRALGLCSGAYHAFKAAVAGQRIEGVIVINPLTFFWKAGQSLDYPAFRVAGEAARYRSSALDLDKWKKFLRGQVRIGSLAQTLGRRGIAVLIDRARDVSRRVGLPWRDDLGVELMVVARRGVDLRFVFATGDPGLELLKGQGGSVMRSLRAGGRLSIELIDGPDHTFTPVWSHRALFAVLGGALDVYGPS